MSTDLSMTSYALLGLLALDARTREEGLTGYEIKQRADRTMRFYWTSPAMSQIYTELDRLAEADLVMSQDAAEGRRRARRFTLSETGLATLEEWLATPPEDPIPVLKHPVALRLMLGAMASPESTIGVLDDYLEQLSRRREELQQVRALLADRHEARYPARVAQWGLSYFDSEREIAEQLRKDIHDNG
ncbi:PadR family transcriptional regulator [Aeromicrobium sp. CTD01-1L150]|uniref:PadR family transcriptional regulator n=1 Tax=Aeromicrobium sp. CTD01-1L150 TaxID=3341830 RepID=UPI0035BFF641